MSQDEGKDGTEPNEKQYEFLVDGTEYVTTSSALTGAQVKAMIANFDPTYQLVQEGKGNEPDVTIGDNQTADLRERPSFYTVPPATFGK